jgi:tetratricopeptide (TPR) repeat protein
LNLIGRELRGIKLTENIGNGAMGAVYAGRVSRPKRGLAAGTIVAVKVLHDHLSGDTSAVTRFKREAGLGLSLRHPNIVKIFQVGTERIDNTQIHFLVQEFIQGETLKAMIRDTCLLSDPFLRKIARQIAGALKEIHEKGIIHRDLKPENVFLDEGGRIKLVDFGFSHKERGLRSGESDRGFLGTVAYAAPERFGTHPVRMDSDLYSFGVVLYELAVGRNPFLAEDITATVARHMYTVPEEPRRINGSVSPFMNWFIRSLLDKDPAKRLGPSSRLVRILEKGEASRWWRSVGPETHPGTLSARRQSVHVIRRTEVYGRQREIAKLMELFDEVMAGKGLRTVCLAGESGAGKTRLIDRLLEELDNLGRPGRLLMVDGAQGTVKVPYLPLISALQSAFGLAGIEREAMRDAFQEKLMPLFPEGSRAAENLARFLISTLPDQADETEEFAPGLAIRLFSELFQALAREEPLIISVENTLIADPPTFQVVSGMLSYLREAPIMVLFTLRPEETFRDEFEKPNDLEGLLKTMEKTGGRNVINLKRLSRADVSRILCALAFPEKVANGPFGERVFAVTEGNPYLVLEIAKLVEVEGRLQNRAVNWHGLLQEIPASIQDLFYRRLFSLSPLERGILDFASVAGRRFTLEEIVDGLGLDFKDAAQALSRLQNRFALIRFVGRFYRFSHILIRELLYSRIEPRERAQFHRIIGEMHASCAEGCKLTGRDSYRAAVHFSRGRDHRRALEFFQEAFDYLRFKHFHDRAYQLAMNAAEHAEALDRKGEAPDPAFRCDLFLKQAEVSGFLGQREVQYKALKAALQAGRSSNVPSLMALVRLRIGQYHHATSRYFSALSMIEGALSWMRRIEDQRGEADALEALANLHKDMGDEERGRSHLKGALALRVRLEDPSGEAGVLVEMAEYYLRRSKPVAAKEALDKAQRIYQKLDDEQGLALVLMGLGRIELERGNFQTAERALKEAGRIAREVGNAALEADIYAGIGACRRERERIPEALAFFKKAHRIASMIKDVARQVRFLTAQARLLIHPENPDLDPSEGLAKARAALALSRKALLNVRDRIGALDALGSVFIKMERPLSAFAIFRKAFRSIEKEDAPAELVLEMRQKYEMLAKRLGKTKNLSKNSKSLKSSQG